MEDKALRKQKQKILRTEILNEGYAADDFENYCLKLRPDGNYFNL